MAIPVRNGRRGTFSPQVRAHIPRCDKSWENGLTLHPPPFAAAQGCSLHAAPPLEGERLLVRASPSIPWCGSAFGGRAVACEGFALDPVMRLRLWRESGCLRGLRPRSRSAASPFEGERERLRRSLELAQQAPKAAAGPPPRNAQRSQRQRESPFGDSLSLCL